MSNRENNYQKIWQIKKPADKHFIQKHPNLNRVILQLLYNREIKEKEEIRKFLEPDYKIDLFDPFLFANMNEAVDLIIKHIKAQNKIVVYGDYDADGITASALLVKALSILHAKVDVYIPYRVEEGYGLNKKAIKYIAQNKTKLIITVDTGIRNKEEIEYAKKLGVDIVLTDHHFIPKEEELPPCLIINPILEEEKYPFKFLAGVGVAFKLATAIISRAKLDKSTKNKIERRLLDLVAVGTIADCVSLLGENRILAKYGLEELNNTKNIGLQELIKATSIQDSKIDSWNVSFQIAPRLNAAGRMDHANTAFELLVTNNREEASVLSRRLNDKNQQRQEVTEEIIQEVEDQLKNQKEEKILIGISKKEQAWNEGVIGLVAGRITEKYYKPTLIISCARDEWRGSGRSIEEFNLIKAIENCKSILNKYGGHRLACGFGVSDRNLGLFIDKIRRIANKELEGIDLRPKLTIETELNLDDITEDLIKEIERLAPFGQDNPRPMFLSRSVSIVDIINMGLNNEHIKLRLRGRESRLIDALGFYQSEKWKNIKIGDIIDIVYYLEMNSFNGYSTPQLKIIDICLQKN